MKKLLWVLLAFFAFSGMAMAAVNLNTATQAELETVKGVGPKKAEAIISYREKNGSFKAVDDLKNVNGFGDKTVAKMRSELTVNGAAPAKADKKVSGKKAEARKNEPKAEAKKIEPAKADAKAGKSDVKTGKK